MELQREMGRGVEGEGNGEAVDGMDEGGGE